MPQPAREAYYLIALRSHPQLRFPAGYLPLPRPCCRCSQVVQLNLYLTAAAATAAERGGRPIRAICVQCARADPALGAAAALEQICADLPPDLTT